MTKKRKEIKTKMRRWRSHVVPKSLFDKCFFLRQMSMLLIHLSTLVMAFFPTWRSVSWNTLCGFGWALPFDALSVVLFAFDVADAWAKLPLLLIDLLLFQWRCWFCYFCYCNCRWHHFFGRLHLEKMMMQKKRESSHCTCTTSIL